MFLNVQFLIVFCMVVLKVGKKMRVEELIFVVVVENCNQMFGDFGFLYYNFELSFIFFMSYNFFRIKLFLKILNDEYIKGKKYVSFIKFVDKYK